MNDRIIIDPEICHGKPVIRGTRTPVSTVLGHLAGGDSFDVIRREYDLTDEDIRSAVAFANEELAKLTFVPAGAGVGVGVMRRRASPLTH